MKKENQKIVRDLFEWIVLISLVLIAITNIIMVFQ